MCNYYAADLYFHHPKAIDMDKRPFVDLEDMHAQLINNWNKKVLKTDTVYILGDFSFCKKAEKVNELLRVLKGKKYLIRGNHDDFVDKAGFDKNLFEGIYNYLRYHIINKKGTRIIKNQIEKMNEKTVRGLQII